EGLLSSQLADLEEPTHALIIDVSISPEEIVAEIRKQLCVYAIAQKDRPGDFRLSSQQRITDSFRTLLRLCRGWRGLRTRRCRSASVIEIHFGSLPRSFLRLEVRIVAGESAQACHQIVGEEREKRVVVLQRFVVTAAFDGDAIFRSGQLVL